MSADVKPYTSLDLRSRAVTDVVLPSRLRATVEALERVTKERDEARGRYYDAKNELDAALAARKLALEQSRTGVLREALNLALNAPECHKDADNYDPFDPECACAGCRARGQARAMARIAE